MLLHKVQSRFSGFLLKTILMTSLTTGFSAVTTAQENSSVEIDKPHAVTVFENRARVTRQRSLDLTAGLHQVIFRKLPAELNPNSLRAIVAGEATEKSLILGVQLEEEFPLKVNHAQEAELLEKLDKVGERLSVNQGKREIADLRNRVLKRYSEILRAVVSAPAGDPQRPLWNLQEVSEIQQWLFTNEVENAEEADLLQSERESLQRERNDLLADLRRYQREARRSYWIASVTCQVLEDCALDLNLSYDVPSARWKPVHEARLNDSTGKVTWKQGAQVTQSSGEDWSAVELTLSTLRSSLGLSVGQLIPIEVSLAERLGDRNAKLVSAPSADPMDSDALPQESAETSDDSRGFDPAGWAAPVMETGFGGVVSFRIQTLSDVPSDGSAHAVEIQSWEAEAELSYEAIPALGAGVYRKARLVQPGPGLLLNGEVQCFRSGTYVGLGNVETIAAGQEFVQFFALEGRLKLHVQDLGEFRSPSGSAFSRPRLEKKSLFAVTSYLDRPVTLELVSRIPVSLVEELEIELGDETEPKPEISRDGICRWNLQIPAGVRKEVIFHWTATADKDSGDLLDLLK